MKEQIDCNVSRLYEQRLLLIRSIVDQTDYIRRKDCETQITVIDANIEFYMEKLEQINDTHKSNK